MISKVIKSSLIALAIVLQLKRDIDYMISDGFDFFHQLLNGDKYLPDLVKIIKQWSRKVDGS